MGSINKIDIDLFPDDLEFSVFTADEIKRLSVVKVITGLTFDVLGHPLPGGLYDSALGTYGRLKHPCTTCYNLQACPGHMGHIELNALFYNPFFIKIVHKMLSIVCFNCQKLQMKDYVLQVIMLQLRLLDAGYIIEAQELEIFKSEVVFQNSTDVVTLPNGDIVHPHIAHCMELLKQVNPTMPAYTKTSNAIRDAITHLTLQRPLNHKCVHCSQKMRSVRYLYRRLVFFMSAVELKSQSGKKDISSGQNKVILADECRTLLRKAYNNHPELLLLLFPILKLYTGPEDEQHSPVDIFFLDTIPVTPSKARPTNVVNEHIVEHPQTAIYRSILENNTVMRVILKYIKGNIEDLTDEAKQVYTSADGESPYEKLFHASQDLQNSIDLLLDVSVSRQAAASSQGLKQILEKKEGLIRKHMMGKRVNYAARTVITPDPNISVDEVGIPDIFARKLTFPMPVTPWNVAELRRMVINGPTKYPGANYIQDEKGYTTIVPADNPSKRESMAKLLYSHPEQGVRIVHRHLLNGDVLLLNRQPSLHRPSIMAHKARILSGEKTFRLHYSNCKAYNADFDGDEMNAHYPQGEVARSEAFNLVNVANNYLVPKDGTPLGGLIQDHVISGVKLSIRGRFFNREDYQQMVYQGLTDMKGNIKLLPPTILKPQCLWSGKQVLSTIILNLIPQGYPSINLDSSAKIQAKHWRVQPPRVPLCGTPLGETEMCESQVTIRHGELLTGVLDKQQYGATTYGFIHCMYELYGGEVSTRLLTAFTRIFTYFLQREGFTLGVKDILVRAAADQKRCDIIKACRKVGDRTMATALGLDEVPEPEDLAQLIEVAYAQSSSFRIDVDRMYKETLTQFNNDINSSCLPGGLVSQFPDNNLQLMVLSGAKGSMVNTMQISCLLGQIELEGKRPPLMVSGKSLPSFAAFETSPKSGGFIDGRFMTGIQPQDFFFHCMAGREGLIDTAVKTSRSGYLQRCLIKHLEGLTVNYDLTVRDSDNCVVQYLYGEDGLDILKSKFFRWTNAAKFFVENANVVLQPHEVENIKDEDMLSEIGQHIKKIRMWRKEHGQLIRNNMKRKMSGFAKYIEDVGATLVVKKADKMNFKTGRRRRDKKLVDMWQSLQPEFREHYSEQVKPCPDPVISVYKQDRCYGSISEQLRILIDKYKGAKKSLLADVLYVKNLRALAAPGDPVGLLAAQSIGEPSTQMTLNTFHFAGRGEMNVTLGIPRLREILMLASSKIKTPTMDVPIKFGQDKAAEKLRLNLNHVTLADVLQNINVGIRLVLSPERVYQYTLHFQFLPRDAYKHNFCVKPKHVLKYINEKFFKQLFATMVKYSKSKTIVIDMGELEKRSAEDTNAGAEDNDNDEAIEVGGRDRVKEDPEHDDESSGNEEEEENEEDGASASKQNKRIQDENEYDDPQDEEEIEDAEGPDEQEEDIGEVTMPAQDNEKESDEEKDDDASEEVLKNDMVVDYTYDKESYLWCKLTFNFSTKYNKPDISSILRELAHKSVLHQVRNVKRAFTFFEKGVNTLKTDGINIIEMFKHDKVLDLNRLYSNDIHAIANTYGIEAAAQVIIKEITNVFSVYGIEVDRRHLSLIADYMTFDGTFQPMSRKGMQYSASPLQQMSFESCLQFLKNAAAFGRTDNLNSPSSRLMVGLPVKTGTGCFELLAKLC